MSNVNNDVSLLVVTIGTALLCEDQVSKKKTRAKRRWWVRPWLMKRCERGAYNGILSEIRLVDHENFRKYLRMNTDTFQVQAHSGLFYIFIIFM